MSYRLGVDVGGTFTDLLVIDDESGRTWRDKVPTTPHDPSEAVVAGTKAICAQAGIGPDALSLFLHGVRADVVTARDLDALHRNYSGLGVNHLRASMPSMRCEAATSRSTRLPVAVVLVGKSAPAIAASRPSRSASASEISSRVL